MWKQRWGKERAEVSPGQSQAFRSLAPYKTPETLRSCSTRALESCKAREVIGEVSTSIHVEAGHEGMPLVLHTVVFITIWGYPGSTDDREL